MKDKKPDIHSFVATTSTKRNNVTAAGIYKIKDLPTLNIAGSVGDCHFAVTDGAPRFYLSLGSWRKPDPASYQKAGAALVTALIRHGITTIDCLIFLKININSKRKACLQAFITGLREKFYRFSYSLQTPLLPALTINLAFPAADKTGLDAILSESMAIMDGVSLARRLSDTPANIATPAWLAAQATELAAKFPKISVETVTGLENLEKTGLNLLSAVGRGSTLSPCMISLFYKGGGARPTVVLIGKGVTFDSGGISLKAGIDISGLKYDMCAGASVLGVMAAVAAQKLAVNLMVLVPTAENMPSSTAYRPGDIITAANGLSIEIVNTDAEGRLLLADAIHYAERFNPEIIIDLGTLTGDCAVALGGEVAALFSNDDQLAGELTKAGKSNREWLWQLPLWPQYHEQLRSEVADIRNLGTAGGGTITAACFLQRFVGDSRRWAHIDIASVATTPLQAESDLPATAKGFGVRLLYDFLRNMVYPEPKSVA